MVLSLLFSLLGRIQGLSEFTSLLGHYHKTMHRAVRNHPLSIKEKRRNRAISRTRALVERPYAVIKRYFRAGHVLVTTRARVHLATMVACFCYNLLQLRTIQRTTS